MNVRWLFVDMNAYFASVEQELRPRLRGKPVAVVPMNVPTTCCIAASYEAKRFGIRTGTKVAEARRLCPGLQIIEARVEEYVRCHHRIVAAVNSVLPVTKVLSIDEMSCRLLGTERELSHAVTLGQAVKRAIREQAGTSLRCSVGLAPNAFLAKVAGEMQKPDGLTTITNEQLPHALYQLELGDLPGIGPGMSRRLTSQGVRTIEELYGLTEDQMARAWGGIVGRRWWHLLRGEDLGEPPTQRRTVGHSHVLGPELRTPERARGVLVKLIHKAAVRLRKQGYWARQLHVQLGYVGGDKWKAVIPLPGPTQDTQTLLGAFSDAWETNSVDGIPLKASMSLFTLTSHQSTTQPLFESERKRVKVAHAMDRINQKLGRNGVYLAAMHDQRDTAPARIAFGSIPDETELRHSVPTIELPNTRANRF